MIYNNLNNLNEEFIGCNDNSELLIEGATYQKNPSNEFYKTAEKIVDQIYNLLKNKGVNRGIFSKDKKFGDEKSFIKSYDKAKKMIRCKPPRLKLKLNLLYLHMASYDDPNNLMGEISKIFVSNGFTLNPSAKSFFKRLVTDQVFYKEVSDDLIIILKPSLEYMTNYGVPTSYTNLKMDFIAAIPTNDTMKFLNLSESCGIFESIRFLDE